MDTEPGGAKCPPTERMFSFRPVKMLAWALVFAGAVAGGIAAYSSVGGPPQADELRIATNAWVGFSFLYVADEKGFFREAGLPVRLLEMGSLADARRVFEQGQADVLGCTQVELMLMNERWQANAAQAFVICDYSTGGDMLLSRKEITTIGDLRGRRIGVEPESLDAWCVEMALQSAGLTFRDAHLVPLSQSEKTGAIEQGLVDAVQIYPPAADAALRIRGVHKLWDSSREPGAVIDVIVARSDWLTKHPEERRLLRQVIQRAQDYYRRHPDECLEILSRRFGQDIESMRSSFAHVRIHWISDGDESRLVANGELQRAFCRTVDGLIDLGLLAAPPRNYPLDMASLSGSP